ncbi:MAG: hypothetical protein JSR59_22675 [Proteobacteria bacterium]|nr:hypothetical protein [Pseudomonadota bacterium]
MPSRSPRPPPPAPDGAPERWSVDAGASDVALLVIPPDARRRRVFEVDCRLAVRVADDADAPWHELRVEIDGAQQWSRRIASHAPSDTLDYHCRCEVAVGRALRVRAVGQAGAQAVRTRLLIEAEEASR